ncbi:MAG TPA: AMP-binding protein, partial [Nocardioides sp.]|nr:AMP-binding protein [Nocardioides sp.]
MSTPELLTAPTPEGVERARVQGFLRWLAAERDVTLATWEELHAWSVAELEQFWAAVWDYFGVRAHAPYETVLVERTMPGTQWFPGALLNYAEHCLGQPEDADRVAVVAVSQTRERRELTFAQLADEVRRARAGLQRLGVGPGDRVAAYLPNIPETLVVFLATASLGAIWASCAPEFGALAVADRFAQVEPKVLLAVAGYTYGDKPVDRRGEVAEIRATLPTVEHVVHVPYGPETLPDATDWADLTAPTDETLAFAPVPFDHPLCILFSSGTTGKPKAIVHRHGGLLLEHLKNHAFHWD